MILLVIVTQEKNKHAYSQKAFLIVHMLDQLLRHKGYSILNSRRRLRILRHLLSESGAPIFVLLIVIFQIVQNWQNLKKH